MSKKEKSNVSVTRSERALIDRNKNPVRYFVGRYKRIMVVLFLILAAVVALAGLVVGIVVWSRNETAKDFAEMNDKIEGYRNGQNEIEVSLTDQQAENMPSNNEGLSSGDSVMAEIIAAPLEVDGELVSGYNIVSFETSDGPFALYDGYFENGLYNGYGSYTTFYPGTNSVKSIYTGEWKDSQPNGIGASKFFYRENGSIRSLCGGNWKDGLIDGSDCKYTEFLADGGTAFEYSGNCRSGSFDGIGRYIEYYEDGKTIKCVYDGMWKDHTMNGQGTMTEYYEDGIKVVRDGIWGDNGLDGPGTVTEYYEDGITVRFVVDGIWKDNQMNGQGTIKNYYEAGKSIKYVYDGTWKDTLPEGQGTATEYYEDGINIKWQYSSQWKSGAPDGDGTFDKYDKDGNILASGTIVFTDISADISVWGVLTEDEAKAVASEYHVFLNGILDMFDLRLTDIVIDSF